uniref:Transcription regulator Myc N-terminal domain-containing protein n=1 Tax=Chelydra serpentina TaxID=8475 RepID=A0A8C3SPZ4_CHESE
MFSKNLDLEFDYLQPCFCPDEDDLYLCGPDSASPGEDIWKKFELLPSPTPGLQVTPAGGAPVPWGGAELWGSADGGDVFETGLGESNNLGSVIVQDCVWGGFPAHETLTRAVGWKGPQEVISPHPLLKAGLRTSPPGGGCLCMAVPPSHAAFVGSITSMMPLPPSRRHRGQRSEFITGSLAKFTPLKEDHVMVQ